MKRLRIQHSGFSLLELAVVLVVVGVITAIAMNSGSEALSATRENATRQRMKALEDAFQAYRDANNRLPCPASLTIAEGATNFGVEGATPGTCTGSTPAANNSAAGVTNTTKTGVEGAVPVVTLGLPTDFMYDGWGRRLRYVVDSSATATTAFTSIRSQCTDLAITIKDMSGNNRTDGAIYALISHGENGHGGYTKNGVISNVGSTNTDEQTNCHCTSAAAAGTYAPTYVQKTITSNAASATDNFDDIVTYKQRWQLMSSWETAASCYQEDLDFYISDMGNVRVRKVEADTGIITTVAGNGTSSFSGDGGAATSASLGSATDCGQALDSSGNIYISDTANNRIRKVTAATGIITTIAGTGTSSFSGDGGLATSATLSGPEGVGVDSNGNIYIADKFNAAIRKVTVATGIITTVAGIGASGGFSGDGGLATSAELATPECVRFDSSDNMYIADYGNWRIRKVTAATGIITTVAGNGTQGYSGDGGAATSASLDTAVSIAADLSGNLYIADWNNNRIRKVAAATGIITTVAGTGTAGGAGDGGLATSAQLDGPADVAVDSSGNLYIADNGNDRIRKVDASTGIITTVVGTGSAGFSGDGGAATSAELTNPWGIVLR